MTRHEFKTLCDTTPAGTELLFEFRDQQVRGKFVGCSEAGVVIEANGLQLIWPRELVDYRKPAYPIPSYS